MYRWISVNWCQITLLKVFTILHSHQQRMKTQLYPPKDCKSLTRIFMELIFIVLIKMFHAYFNFYEITIFLCFITFIINLHNCLYIFEYFVICITRLLTYCHLYLCYFLWWGVPSLALLLCFTYRSCCLFPSCVYYLDFKLKPFPSSLSTIFV